MEDFIVEAVTQGGPTTILLAMIIAFMRGMIIPKSVVDKLECEGDARREDIVAVYKAMCEQYELRIKAQERLTEETKVRLDDHQRMSQMGLEYVLATQHMQDRAARIAARVGADNEDE